MAQRLSDLSGQYQQTGGLLESYSITAAGGETTFPLTFTEGNEEVYLNGSRMVRGAVQDYTTLNGQVILNDPLIANDVLFLVGRSADATASKIRSQSESVTLSVNGERSITFTTIETTPISVYVSGSHVDSGMLVAGRDYTINSATSITLVNSFPVGTVITGVQGDRSALADPTSMVVNDTRISKDLGSRFRDTMESIEYFRWSNGRQLIELSVGATIQRWIPSSNGLTPVVNPNKDGYYPVVQLNNVLYEPVINSTDAYRVISWSLSEGSLVVNALNIGTGSTVSLEYVVRIDRAAAGTATNPFLLGAGDNKVSMYTTGDGTIVIEGADGVTRLL